MSSVNKAILIGGLGKDPEVKFTGSGKAVCKLSLATEEQWQDASGEKQKETTWHNIVVWGKQAEACGKHLEKGSRVYVEGRIANRSYDDKDGVKKYVTEVIATNVRFLSFKKDEQRSGSDGSGRQDRDSESNDGW